jgi:hypothetical protein
VNGWNRKLTAFDRFERGWDRQSSAVVANIACDY